MEDVAAMSRVQCLIDQGESLKDITLVAGG